MEGYATHLPCTGKVWGGTGEGQIRARRGICSLGMGGKVLTDRTRVSHLTEAFRFEQGSVRYVRTHGNFLREQNLCRKRKSSL